MGGKQCRWGILLELEDPQWERLGEETSLGLREEGMRVKSQHWVNFRRKLGWRKGVYRDPR